MATPGATHLMLRYPLSMSVLTERAPALARHLARLTLALPGLVEGWSQPRAIAWAGDASSQAAFVEALARAGVVLPEARLPLQHLTDLDELIDTFHRDCRGEDDWLLCAGVVSVEIAEESDLPGEAGFLWRVSRQGRQLLHRGEYQAGEAPAELCSQIQRYAGLEARRPLVWHWIKPARQRLWRVVGRRWNINWPGNGACWHTLRHLSGCPWHCCKRERPVSPVVG